MTKILFFTDSHGRFDNIYKMVEKEKPDIVISAGDYSKDALELSYAYEDLKFYIVDGNCDIFNSKAPEEEIFYIENIKIFLTHGHLYGVKADFSSLLKKAKEIECDLVLYGHTHKNNYQNYPPILYNPGAALSGYYGIIEIDGYKINIETKNILL